MAAIRLVSTFLPLSIMANRSIFYTIIPNNAMGKTKYSKQLQLIGVKTLLLLIQPWILSLKIKHNLNDKPLI